LTRYSYVAQVVSLLCVCSSVGHGCIVAKRCEIRHKLLLITTNMKHEIAFAFQMRWKICLCETFSSSSFAIVEFWSCEHSYIVGLYVNRFQLRVLKRTVVSRLQIQWTQKQKQLLQNLFVFIFISTLIDVLSFDVLGWRLGDSVVVGMCLLTVVQTIWLTAYNTSLHMLNL